MWSPRAKQLLLLACVVVFGSTPLTAQQSDRKSPNAEAQFGSSEAESMTDQTSSTWSDHSSSWSDYDIDGDGSISEAEWEKVTQELYDSIFAAKARPRGSKQDVAEVASYNEGLSVSSIQDTIDILTSEAPPPVEFGEIEPD